MFLLGAETTRRAGHNALAASGDRESESGGWRHVWVIPCYRLTFLRYKLEIGERDKV